MSFLWKDAGLSLRARSSRKNLVLEVLTLWQPQNLLETLHIKIWHRNALKLRRSWKVLLERGMSGIHCLPCCHSDLIQDKWKNNGWMVSWMHRWMDRIICTSDNKLHISAACECSCCGSSPPNCWLLCSPQ